MEFLDVLVGYEVRLWDALDRELTRQGECSLAQLHALRVVDRHAGWGRVQELSDEIGITVGAASKMVDRLERDGLVTRSPNPANRRSSLVSLTATGRRATAAGTDVCRAALAAALGDEDVEALTATLRRLRVRLDAQPLRATACPDAPLT